MLVMSYNQRINNGTFKTSMLMASIILHNKKLQFDFHKLLMQVLKNSLVVLHQQEKQIL